MNLLEKFYKQQKKEGNKPSFFVWIKITYHTLLIKSKVN